MVGRYLGIGKQDCLGRGNLAVCVVVLVESHDLLYAWCSYPP